MSLYDGLGVDTGSSKKDNAAADKKTDVSGWSAGIKMMQSHLRMKKAALTEAQRKMKQPTLPPVVDLKKVPGPSPGPSAGSRSEGEGSGSPVTGGVLEENARFKSSNLVPPPRPTASLPRTAPSYLPASNLGSDGENEYDPAYPNEYEKVAKKLREKRDREREEQERREREERRRRRQRERERERERDRERDRDRHDRDRDRERDFQGFSRRPASDDEDDDRDRDRRRASVNRAAIAPPSSLVKEDSQMKDDEFAAPLPPTKDRPYAEIMKRKKQDEDDPEGAKTPPRVNEFAPPPEPNTFVKPPVPKLNFQPPVGLGADSVAAKIMAKYGFKEGAGLGKSEQGISTALQVEKTSRRGGKIINKDKEVQQQEQAVMPPPSMPPPPAPKAAPITDILRNPTKILLLLNMVGPGEVDDDLQPETAEECSKYGEVVKVLIYEDQLKPANEAVRIFVEFTRVESAVKAVVDLNGRFFGGKIVKASFYDQEKFEKFDLTA